jgi:hypothetical protein
MFIPLLSVVANAMNFILKQWKKEYKVKRVVKKFPKHPHYKILAEYWPGTYPRI